MRVSVKQARELLQDDSLTDEEVEAILDSLYYLARNILNKPLNLIPSNNVAIDGEIINLRVLIFSVLTP